MKKKILAVLCTCIFIMACHKREYKPDLVQLEEEDIYCSGYVDNEPISLKIGTDGYYCYTSYEQRADSIYVFEGELKKFECTSCPQALRIELSDYMQRLPGTSVPVDSSLRNGKRGFIPAMPRINTMRFLSHSNKEAASFHWEVSNGISSQDPILECEFTQPGPQTVSLTITTKGNCESRVVNTVFIGGESDLFACSVTAQLVQNTTSEFKPGNIGGKPPYTYLWYFGDGTTSTLSEPVHSYAWAGSYPVKLRIQDADNHVCESNYIHIAGNDNSSCAANMSFSRQGSRNAFLNGVKVQWTDQANAILRSDSIAQPAESYFEIINSQEYAPNEKGDAGRLLTLRFNVLLSDGSRKVWFKSDNTAIAVSYK